ncbi:hypothetical protein [Stratiformator vulcanicus]|uniref:Uncharacterized protein n=1 Tax=Stratiformator vulcanicus TaxID=2527980 RepID=A0A517R7A5_9PLAN|nr:hypothetical protein [Stratiformator vulcanicus]QDT39755.1 hypothetical protein Pan189_41640 [Stratiformator vulcanicus]
MTKKRRKSTAKPSTKLPQAQCSVTLPSGVWDWLTSLISTHLNYLGRSDRPAVKWEAEQQVKLLVKASERIVQCPDVDGHRTVTASTDGFALLVNFAHDMNRRYGWGREVELQFANAVSDARVRAENAARPKPKPSPEIAERAAEERARMAAEQRGASHGG